jgi:hypothetical protein
VGFFSYITSLADIFHDNRSFFVLYREFSLYGHLVFALKYEGINLLLLKKLFEKLTDKTILHIIKINAESQFTFRLWFLYEFLIQKKLQLPDADNKIRYTLLIEQWIDLPNLSLLATFISQNQGKLSDGKREKFFPQLNHDEVGKTEMT